MTENAAESRVNAWGADYVTGDDGWFLLLSRSAVLLIDGQDDAALAGLLEALGAPDAGGAVLGRLLTAGIPALPAFAFAEEVDSGWRVMVRGIATVEVGGETVTGADYTTWAERLLPAGELSVSGPTQSSGRRLTLREGVAPASAATVRAGGASSSSTTAAEALAPATEPAMIIAGPPPAAEETAADPDPFPFDTPAPVVASTPTSTPTPAPATPPAASAPPPAPETRISEHTIAEFTSSGHGDAYAHLFEETVVRPIEAAAIREAESETDVADQPVAPAASSAPPTETGEHDGMTVLSGDLKKLREQAAAENSARREVASGDLVLVFSTGRRESLTGSVIVGRSPSAAKVSAGSIPRLVAIPDDPDLSRSHVRIDLSGDSAVVTDLHSRNGTSIELPGQSPQRLRGGVPSTVLPGTVIDLGGGLTITVSDETDPA